MEKIFVPRQNLAALEAKFLKASRKAVKLGMPAPKLQIFEDEMEIRDVILETFNDRRELKIAFVPVTFSGEIPVIKGWNLAASVEHSRIQENEINYNTVRMVPGYDDLHNLRTCDPTCDHCGHNRFRKNTYLLRNSETGEFCRVGSSCLKDFLGDVDPSFVVNSVNHLKFLDTFMDEFEHIGGFYVQEFDIQEVLELTNAVIRVDGWLSRGKAMDICGLATADYVSEITFSDPAFYSYKMKKIVESINEDDVKLAEDALAWINSFDLSDPNLNDYLYNCAVCAKRQLISSKDFGIACSIIASYKNKLAKEVKIAQEKECQKESNFIGSLKERLRDVPVTFMNAWMFDSSFGICTIMKFMDDDGNVIIWKTGAYDQLEVGEKFLMTGTVKKHDIYRDVKQTTLSRCILTEVD